ncbi:unnamed protein product [Linum tenue]|uniref:C2 domain-containing protein n=1 Tax=Linum tenue TaxID=586396 RepID=A0AAV0PGE0_9ROSI|nr:unnamed protein product [Linum tenue]
MESKILEINLISAQGLKPPSAKLRQLQTYAVVWIHSAAKLRTQVDRVGGANPTWNDKFLFRVSPNFLSNDTSGVSVEIYAVGCLRDSLVGTVRFLISNLSLSSPPADTPSFTALQIRRPSGRCHGVLNIGASAIDAADFTAWKGESAIGYRELMGNRAKNPRRSRGSKEAAAAREDRENSCCETGEFSDGTESTTSSSSNASTALKDLTKLQDLARNSHLRASSDGGVLCGLLMQRRIRLCRSDPNLRDPDYSGSEKEN